jgi:hypothetical protein
MARVIFLLIEEKIFFRNQPIRNKNCLWWPCLLTNQDKMSNLYRGSSIDASYQVSVHLAKRFQRRRFLKKHELPVAAMFVIGQVGIHILIFFLAILAKGNNYELLPSLGVRPLSTIYFSYFNLLL